MTLTLGPSHIGKGHLLLKIQNHLDNHIFSDDTVAALIRASVTKHLTVCSHSFQLTVSSFFSFLHQQHIWSGYNYKLSDFENFSLNVVVTTEHSSRELITHFALKITYFTIITWSLAWEKCSQGNTLCWSHKHIHFQKNPELANSQRKLRLQYLNSLKISVSLESSNTFLSKKWEMF